MSIRQKLAIVAGIYLIEGFPMGVVADVWPVYLRTHGASLREIGWVAGLSVAWTLKFFWSPLVGRFGDYRHWIAGALLCMSLALILIGSSAPYPMTPLLITAFAVYCLASATQDIAIDAYAIGLTSKGEEAPINSMKASAYRIGMLFGGAALLYLPSWIGWSHTFYVAAVFSVVMLVGNLATPRVPGGTVPFREMGRALQRWGHRPALLAMLCFVFLYRIGDISMGPMVKPFWVDRGYAPERIADFTVTLGTIMVIAGATAGGFIMHRIGLRKALFVLGACALGSNFLYAAAAAFPEWGSAGMIGASAFESFSAGLGSMAFMSFLMRICEREHAAVQYALLTALAGLGRVIHFASGQIAEAIGYASFFALTGLLALPSLLLIPWLYGWIEGFDDSPSASGS